MGFVAGLFLVLIFPGLLAIAAAGDVARYRIANGVTGTLAFLAPVAAFAAGVPWGAISLQLAAGALCLGALLPFFLLRQIGGGDVKLFAACACWTGLDLLPMLVVATAVIGGAAALAVYAIGRIAAHARPSDGTNARASHRGHVPYGVAIAVGTLCLIGQLPVTRVLFG